MASLLHALLLSETRTIEEFNDYFHNLMQETRTILAENPFNFHLVLAAIHPPTTLAMINVGADVNGRIADMPHLMRMCMVENKKPESLECMRLLIENNADVNLFGSVDKAPGVSTALNEAVENKNLDKCMLLMQNGADPFQHTVNSIPAMHLCSNYTNEEVGNLEWDVWWTLHAPYFLAFAMGNHGRLGRESVVFMLDNSVVPIIVKLITPFRAFVMPAIHE